MKILELADKVKEPLFSLHDLKILKISVFPYQLTRWVGSGYLLKVRNGLYAFADRRDRLSMELISHRLYEPSYISLERALSRHGLIPEIVYNSTAVTTRQTKIFENEFGIFSYRSIKPEFFFGYAKVREAGGIYLLAEPEKALLDYLYLNSAKLKGRDDVRELRINDEALQRLNKKTLRRYLKAFSSRRLEEVWGLIANG